MVRRLMGFWSLLLPVLAYLLLMVHHQHVPWVLLAYGLLLAAAAGKVWKKAGSPHAQ